MSLVNDALRRAKQHTAQPVPDSNLQLRPMEPAHTEPPSFMRRFPILLTLLGIVAVALVITAFFREGHENIVQARRQPTPAPVPENNTSVPTPAMAPAPVQPVPQLAAKPETEPASQPTNPPTMVAEAPSLRLAPPKLQAILFSAKSPSAIIDGRTVFVGSRIGEFQVASITPSSAMLVSGTQTNVLRFEE